jgi:hypothetical protein
VGIYSSQGFDGPWGHFLLHNPISIGNHHYPADSSLISEEMGSCSSSTAGVGRQGDDEIHIHWE